MRIFVSTCIAMLLTAQMALATTWSFDITARIDSAFLRNPSEDALVQDGAILHGRLTYSDPPTRQSGSDYYYTSGLETFEIWTDAGYRLSMSPRIISIAEFGGSDFFVAQTFQSEDPNGWNMVLDIITTGWLMGDTSLPTRFPDTFDYAYLSAYFLDQADMIQTIDARVLSIQPTAAVPLPASGVLLVGGLAALMRARRKRRAV